MRERWGIRRARRRLLRNRILGAAAGLRKIRVNFKRLHPEFETGCYLLGIRINNLPNSRLLVYPQIRIKMKKLHVRNAADAVKKLVQERFRLFKRNAVSKPG